MDDIREKVREFYGNIAEGVTKATTPGGCGGTACCPGSGQTANPIPLYGDSELNGLPSEAVNASLGCANPLPIAKIKAGDVVLDLGSGGGINVFMASRLVGESGKVYGLDMTDEMLALAKANQEKMGVRNVEFIKGYIEDIPLPDRTVDVIISNCVINLSADKGKVLTEAYRVLKPGGRFAVSDIVLLKDIPSELKDIAALWTGCVAGALPAAEYRVLLGEAGFSEITISPESVYTREIIEAIAQSFGGLDIGFLTGEQREYYLNLADGAFAGANITAIKP